MESKWRKLKLALGMKLCVHHPKTLEDQSDMIPDGRLDLSATPVPSSTGLRLPKHYSGSFSKNICAICLNDLKLGDGHAIFTAECSHSFHFHCITSNIMHGNRICPVCRDKWKEIPIQIPARDESSRRRSVNHVSLPQSNPRMTNARRIPSRVYNNRHSGLPFHVAEPSIFDDDEFVDHLSYCKPTAGHSAPAIEVKTYTELPAISKSESYNDFTVLIHLKAPRFPLTCQESRAPVDLVTVLDVSGSMAGTKIALLKRAMGFVIQNLGPSDRLSVIAFSSTARRLLPLRRMTEIGQKEALQAVNRITPNGDTNIAEGLKKGARVMSERRSKNPVTCMILLSDGRDTYCPNILDGVNRKSYYPSLLPVSFHCKMNAGPRVPVHTFGFGTDHDAVAMHTISEASGGTFSFIETEAMIQDAFAQCIGGLLSVVVQELETCIECSNPNVRLNSIKAGSYKSTIKSKKRMGLIEVGDLYAEEERDFLITLDVPVSKSSEEMLLLKVKCIYKDPFSKKLVILNCVPGAKICRPEVTGQLTVSIEVDKQQNRVRTAEAMAKAKGAAEIGELDDAVSILAHCRKVISESVSLKSGDILCISLDAELREMQERMANKKVYEFSGRAYVLSGLSSHSWQRATARGDSIDSTSIVHSYQTPSMVNMVNRSQTMLTANTSSHTPSRSFPVRQQRF